jgi:hypothetical protein
MPEHKVKQGECISSIADQYGLFWDTVWNDPGNAELKQLRKDPNVLLPGDVVHVPDKREKRESCAAESRHRFRKKGVPAKIKLRLLLDEEPRADEPYKLCIDGVWREGTTDGDGCVKETLPPNAREGTLVVGKGKTQDTYELRFGTVDPIESDDGIRGRLVDLGYDAEEDLPDALREFQAAESLEATGQIDDATRSKLKEKFGQ